MLKLRTLTKILTHEMCDILSSDEKEYKILVGKPARKRLFGRPRRRW
jgi:hypothetical protein